MKKYLSVLFFILISATYSLSVPPSGEIRVLVVTGNHSYATQEFNDMMSSLGSNITFQVWELPRAYEMFALQNRSKYDVILFYHMYQEIDSDQKKNLVECIGEGKPVVALHHSICAFDNWPEYYKIIGGKYFHVQTKLEDKDYPAGTYIHGLKFIVKIADTNHPVTKGVKDFEIFDETYKGYYVEEGVKPLLTTSEPSSTPVIGWTKKYGKARIVTLQSGHDVPTYENPSFRKILKQAIEWVCATPAAAPSLPDPDL